MTHIDTHFGPEGTENDPNYWNSQADYDAWMSAMGSADNAGATPPASGGQGKATQTPYMLSNGITMKQVMDVMKRWQDPNVDTEKLNQFLAWYTWYQKRYAYMFDTNETIRDHRNDQDSEISKDTIARWTALVSAAAKVDSPAPEGTQLEGDAFIQAPEPYTIRIEIMKQEGDGTMTPDTAEIVLDEDSWNILKNSTLIRDYLGKVTESADGNVKTIDIHAGGWWDLKDGLLNPAILGVDETDVPALARIYSRLNGVVEQANPYNPREDQMPALPAELIKTGIAWSYDPITKRPELIDTLPWVGPSPSSLRWIPKDPNNPTGRGSWEIDQANEAQVGKSMLEGVPASVRPWLNAVLNSGGDMTVIDGAIPAELRNLSADEMAGLSPDQQNIIKRKDSVKHWVGYLLGQARLASDPKYAMQPVEIPMGMGEPPINVAGFDIKYPNFVNSTGSGSDFGLGTRAAAALGADSLLQTAGSWYDQWNAMDRYEQIGSEGRQGNFPPLYFSDRGDTAGKPTVDGVPVMDAKDIIDDIRASLIPSNAKPMPGTTESANKDAGGTGIAGDMWKYNTTGQGKYSSSAFLAREYDAEGNVLGYWDTSPDNLAVWVNTDAEGNVLSRNPGTSDRAARLRWLDLYGTEAEKELWAANYPTEEQEEYNFVLSQLNSFKTASLAEIARLEKLGEDVPDWMRATAAGDWENEMFRDPALQQYVGTVTSLIDQAAAYDKSVKDKADADKAAAAKAEAERLAKAAEAAADAAEKKSLEELAKAKEAEAQRLAEAAAAAAAAAEAQRLADLEAAKQPDDDTQPTGETETEKAARLAAEAAQREAQEKAAFEAYEASTAPADTEEEEEDTFMDWTGGIEVNQVGDSAADIAAKAAATKAAQDASRAAASQKSDAYAEQQWQDYLASTGQTGVTGTDAAKAYTEYKGSGGVLSIPAKPHYGKVVESKGAKGTYTGTTATGTAQDDADKAAFEAYEGVTGGSTGTAADTVKKSQIKKQGSDWLKKYN